MVIEKRIGFLTMLRILITKYIGVKLGAMGHKVWYGYIRPRITTFLIHTSAFFKSGRGSLRAALRTSQRALRPAVLRASLFPGLQNITRLAMVFSCIYTLIFLFSIKIPSASEQRLVLAENAVEIGMGGMSYDENTFAGITVTNVSLELGEIEMLDGIPEPEEYSRPQILVYTMYKVQAGDNISALARFFGLNQDTLFSVNNITNARGLQIGQELKIPNQDGLLYTVQAGDDLRKISLRFDVGVDAIKIVNELFSETSVNAGSKLFIPGARLEWSDVQERNGDLFRWPVRGYITSNYGSRPSPFTGARQFHSGMDIGAATGTPIKAAMSGRVTFAGYNDVYGNYVVITHSSVYRTLYGHMSVIKAKNGAYVNTGDIIGLVGSTGQSTGPHLHFTVYKNGVTVNPRELVN